MSDEQHPISRWSQRKLAARQGDVVEETADERKPPDAPAPSPEAEAPVLPSIDSLDAQSDYTAFLSDKVPEALTRAALRKLWTSDPVFANLDGLNHYDDDYNVVDKAISLAQTGYHPDWGYLSHGAEDLSADAPNQSSESPAASVEGEPMRQDAAAGDGPQEAPESTPPGAENSEDSIG